MKALLRRWKDISIAKKLYLVVGGMALLILCELLALQFAMRTLTAARAFVGGEGLWSKAQKNAIISLQHFGTTKDEKYYQDFLNYLKIPEGDHLARMELRKPNPDRDIIHKGFMQGRVQKEDIDPMIDLITRFHQVSYLNRAIAVWEEADNLLVDFKKAGDTYYKATQNGDTDLANKAFARIQAVNEELTVIEEEFSNQLGAGSRWLEYLVLTLLTVAVLVVETIGLTLTIFTIRGISRDLGALNNSAHLIGQGNFSEPAKLSFSKDEIGQLASSITKMGKMLQQSYSDLENRVQIRTRELDESKNQLNTIVKGISDGITVTNTQGNFVFANETGAKICGFENVEEMLKTPLSECPEYFEVLDEEGLPISMEHLPYKLALQGTEEAPEVLIRIRQKKTGDQRWLLVTSSPIFDESSQARLTVTIFKDFTERKRSEDAVKFLDEANNILTSSLDYELTLQNLANLIVPKLADWCTISILEEDKKWPRNIALSHLNPDKVHWAKALNEKYPTDWNAPTGAGKVLRTGQPEFYPCITDEMLVQAARDDEHLKVLREISMNSVIMVPLKARGKSFGVIAMIAAESGRKYDRQDLILAEDLARRASAAIDNTLLFKDVQRAVKARDEFISIASHELKTPLTSLSLQIQMTRQNINPELGKAPSPEKLAGIFDISDKQVIRLTRLVEDLLDASRIQSGNLRFDFEKANITDVVKDMMARFSDQLSKVNCQTQVSVQENVIGYVDVGRLEQIIENLLTNVIKYAPGKPLHVSLSSTASTAKLSIHDSGPGIPPEMQTKIFERFERANSSRYVTGLGLGLYIVKEFVNAHQGKISLESQIGLGSKFIVEIPLGVHSKIASHSQENDRYEMQ